MTIDFYFWRIPNGGKIAIMLKMYRLAIILAAWFITWRGWNLVFQSQLSFGEEQRCT